VPPNHGHQMENPSVPFHPTLAITWPQGEPGMFNSHGVAAQVNGDVRSSECKHYALSVFSFPGGLSPCI